MYMYRYMHAEGACARLHARLRERPQMVAAKQTTYLPMWFRAWVPCLLRTLSSSTLKNAAISLTRSLMKSIIASLSFNTTSGSNVKVSL